MTNKRHGHDKPPTVIEKTTAKPDYDAVLAGARARVDRIYSRKGAIHRRTISQKTTVATESD